MTENQIVNFLIEIAESEPPNALTLTSAQVEVYLAKNPHLDRYEALSGIAADFRGKSLHIINRLSMEILEKLTERLPVGY